MNSQATNHKTMDSWPKSRFRGEKKPIPRGYGFLLRN
jgi:hypothetical protein